MALLLWKRDPSIPLQVEIDSLFGEVVDELPVSARTAEDFRAVEASLEKVCAGWKVVAESEQRLLFIRLQGDTSAEILLSVECDQVVVQASADGPRPDGGRAALLPAVVVTMDEHGFSCFDERLGLLVTAEDLLVEQYPVVAYSLLNYEPQPRVDAATGLEVPLVERLKDKRKVIAGWASVTVTLVSLLVGFLVARQEKADRDMAIATTPAIEIIFRRVDGLPCSDPFPVGYRNVSGSDAQCSVLQAAIWLDGRDRGRVAVSTQDPEIDHARCYAVGPHRDLNLENWCCRPAASRPTKGSPRSSR